MNVIKRISVLCTGNICRSPMAAAVLQFGLDQAHADVVVSSAGLAAMGGYEADAYATKLMKERGLDISDHRGKQFTSKEGLKNDLILVMSSAQQRMVEENWPLLHGRVYRVGHWENFDVDDPYERGEPAFRKALKTIDIGTSRWLEIITA
jgi:protein-tyrosine phosphatase